jgi:DNA-binding response OmpR family regulator
MENIQILWADDEIDLLKPHVLFLEQKGYQVDTVTNGEDALDLVRENRYDIVFLDEQMPGLTGIDTLVRIKNLDEKLPVVMITKSEEETIMEDAIGSRISDYLIKPVNPNQILLSIKKNLDTRRLVSEKTTSDYQQDFRKIGMDLMGLRDHNDWADMYRKLTYWELELERLDDPGMQEILNMQRAEANSLFSKFVDENYQDWVNDPEDGPLMSPSLLPKEVFPHLGEKPVFLFVIDNLRFDQWKVLWDELSNYYQIVREQLYYSILPTATQFARNALFAGLMPLEIKKKFPELWVDDTEEGGKNLHEDDFLEHNLKRHGKGSVKWTYNKVIKLDYARRLASNMKGMSTNDLNVIVYNFVDMLSHAKTEMEVIRELADNDKAYRSLTLSWFKNAPLFEMFRSAAEMDARVFLTTDHGTINVKDPTKVIGDRNTNTNLRYKQGKSLSFETKEVYAVQDPEKIHLPSPNVSTKYIFAKEDLFFAYPNNYNHYVKYYRNTYQHGGISLEEMIIPFVELKAR